MTSSKFVVKYVYLSRTLVFPKCFYETEVIGTDIDEYGSYIFGISLTLTFLINMQLMRLHLSYI